MADLSTIWGKTISTIWGKAVTSMWGRPVAAAGGPAVTDLPAPTHYWDFESLPFPDPNTSNVWGGVGGTLGLEAVAGGISGNAVRFDGANQLLNESTFATPTDRVLFSYWMKDEVGASLMDVLIDMGGGGAAGWQTTRPDPSNAAIWDGSTWHHVFVDFAGYHLTIYLDGELAYEDTEYVAWPDYSYLVRISAGTGTGLVDKMYVWSDPTMGTLTGAQMAALTMLATWNGTSWTEL